MYTHIPL
jgi:hypothetical protein